MLYSGYLMHFQNFTVCNYFQLMYFTVSAIKLKVLL